ncbi:hypothetical protein H4R19_003281 [Coemansia spiralis]|nr:hypothetical protein H4R19_003281 [Coemansia spiralis]
MSTFGVYYCSDSFRKLANSLRQYLLVRNGEYIGSYLAIKQVYKRSPEEQQLKDIIRAWMPAQPTDTSVRSRGDVTHSAAFRCDHRATAAGTI